MIQEVDIRDLTLCVDCGRTVRKKKDNFFLDGRKRRYICQSCKEEREVLWDQMDIGEFQEWQGV